MLEALKQSLMDSLDIKMLLQSPRKFYHLNIFTKFSQGKRQIYSSILSFCHLPDKK